MQLGKMHEPRRRKAHGALESFRPHDTLSLSLGVELFAEGGLVFGFRRQPGVEDDRHPFVVLGGELADQEPPPIRTYRERLVSAA